jgi:chemotaxis protein methyltransferase CheR
MSVAIAAAAAPKSKINPTTWVAVQQFMLRSCGVELREDQSYLMEPRLAAAAKAHGFPNVNDYVVATCFGAATTPGAKSLIDAMTTHETMFYRDPAFWSALESLVLPRLVETVRSVGRARIWSGACSTGQEPYSLTMLLEEKAPDIADRVEIIATDVAEPSVDRARKGVFTPLEVNRNVNVMRLMKHFDQAPGGFRIKDALRKRVTFETHNLLGANRDPSNCDLVLCRNVLIYFGDTDRSAVLRRLNAAAKPNGFIALGSTETWREGKLIAPGWYQKSVSL